MKRLLLAPFTMHRRVLELIRRETRNARDGKPARIIAKMNALVEEGVIRALYAASAAGVEIDLIVRGACSLRPGVPGVSENIRVRSILGRFLEHHRVWYFENDGEPGRVAVVGRLDGAQPVPPRGGRVSGARSGAAQARDRRGTEGVSRRQPRGVGARRRRTLVEECKRAARRASDALGAERAAREDARRDRSEV